MFVCMYIDRYASHRFYLVIVKAIDLYPCQVFIVQHFPNALHFPILDVGVGNARVTLIIIESTASYTIYEILYIRTYTNAKR